VRLTNREESLCYRHSYYLHQVVELIHLDIRRILMFDLVAELSHKSQALSPEDRARLAELLLDSMHHSKDQTIEDAWDEELKRRTDQAERGVATLVSAEDGFAQVRRAIR
jgi:putative addiction module component (TIGR02574 family)